ncbi:MAG: LeuA family protein [Francisellaceae bacterium]
MINIFDTTLRDGEQSIGFLMSKNQKLQILEKLCEIDVFNTIELGMPVASIEDQQVFYEASRMKVNKTIAALSRLKRQDIILTATLLNDFSHSRIQLLCIGSELHLKKKRKLTYQEALRELNDSLHLLKNLEFSGTVSLIFEDASRGEHTFIFSQIDLALKYGIRNVVIADTVGCFLPYKAFDFIKKIVKNYPQLNISVHFHNDLGLATANTLCAIKAGAKEIQTTLGGIGERCGNCPVEEVLACLKYEEKKNNFDIKSVVSAIDYMYDVLGKQIDVRKPIVGQHAFATCAGIHQDGINKCPEIYEFMHPEVFGRQRKFVNNRLSSNKLQDTSYVL